MDLANESRSVVTPGYKRDPKMTHEDVVDLSPRPASLYRAMVARANYLAQDRSDIRFAVKELCRRMAKPRVADIKGMKRLARYLVGCPRAIMSFSRQPRDKTFLGWSDSDWAGCVETRKSTSAGVVMWGVSCDQNLEFHAGCSCIVLRGS